MGSSLALQVAFDLEQRPEQKYNASKPECDEYSYASHRAPHVLAVQQ
jgi:hypothetical protein